MVNGFKHKKNQALLDVLSRNVHSLPETSAYTVLIKQFLQACCYIESRRDKFIQCKHPFLWFTIEYFFVLSEDISRHRLKVDVLLYCIFCFLLDAFSAHVDHNHVFIIESALGELSFPFLDIVLHENQRYVIKVINHEVFINDDSVKVRSANSEIKLICLRSKKDLLISFFPVKDLHELNYQTNHRYFQQQLDIAVKRLSQIDKKIFHDVTDNLFFIIPMLSDDDEVSRSFTNACFYGLSFVSDNNCSLKLLEVLVHESQHNFLNLCDSCVPLFIGGVDKFYSPWKNDLRPAEGLFHAIFVFVVIISLYSTILINKLYETSEYLFCQTRATKIRWQLFYAFQENKNLRASLTTEGQSELDRCINIFTKIDEQLKGYILSCPEEVNQHLKHFLNQEIS